MLEVSTYINQLKRIQKLTLSIGMAMTILSTTFTQLVELTNGIL